MFKMHFASDFTMTINGRAASANETLTVLNPATEEPIAQVPDISPGQLDEVIATARTAFKTWKATALAERVALVRALGDRLVAHVDELAGLLMREQGKPLADAAQEIGASAYWLKETSAQPLEPEILSDAPGRRVELRHVPIGVVAAIVPWNFPMGLAMWKIAPALMAGNTVILKPSPFTPLTSLKFGELVRDMLPPGVLSVVSGSDRLGPWITGHPGIDKISFTGSTATGKAVMRSAADSLKRVTLELGGNDPAIVLPDADPETLAPRLFWAAFANAGQLCIASKRIYVHESIYDRFAAAMVDYAKTVKIGDGTEPGVQIGPIQNRPQYERVRALLAEAQSSGVHFLLGGDAPDRRGYFIPIAIADNPGDSSRIVAEEAFGPVVPLLKFSDVDEVVARANATPFGLAASVWGTDIDAAQVVADRIEAGTVWINTIHELDPNQPFGGHKQSGLGAENGREGLLEFTCPQVMIRCGCT
jgi:acyl-CoA reductase-like NAD-dependent aldehyde dehydrogenase